MQMLGDQLNAAPSLNQLTIPDLWQQQAETALREGCDVVVQAPTGSGKTLTNIPTCPAACAPTPSAPATCARKCARF